MYIPKGFHFVTTLVKYGSIVIKTSLLILAVIGLSSLLSGCGNKSAKTSPVNNTISSATGKTYDIEIIEGCEFYRSIQSGDIVGKVDCDCKPKRPKPIGRCAPPPPSDSIQFDRRINEDKNKEEEKLKRQREELEELKRVEFALILTRLKAQNDKLKIELNLYKDFHEKTTK